MAISPKELRIDVVALQKVYDFEQIAPKLGEKCMTLCKIGSFLACK